MAYGFPWAWVGIVRTAARFSRQQIDLELSHFTQKFLWFLQKKHMMICLLVFASVESLASLWFDTRVPDASKNIYNPASSAASAAFSIFDETVTYGHCCLLTLILRICNNHSSILQTWQHGQQYNYTANMKTELKLTIHSLLCLAVSIICTEIVFIGFSDYVFAWQSTWALYLAMDLYLLLLLDVGFCKKISKMFLQNK